MTNPVYVQIEFVTLNQKKPSDWPNTGSSAPKLFFGSLETKISKYQLEVGFGDPGENPSFDFFDYPEFRISGISYERPADFAAKGTFQREGPNGGTISDDFKKWELINVPDGFSIPSNIDIINSDPVNNDETIVTIRDPFAPIFNIGKFELEWSSLYLKGSPTNAITAFKDVITKNFNDTVENFFGKSIINSISNAETIKNALTAIANNSVNAFSYGIEQFNNTNFLEFNTVIENNFNSSRKILTNALAEQIRISAPVEVPLVIIKIPGYRFDIGFDWQNFAAEHIVDSLSISAIEIKSSITQGVQDRSAQIIFEKSGYWRSDGKDIVYSGWARETDLGSGDDVVISGPNSDSAILKAGNDSFFAGAGLDTVYYDAPRSAFKISREASNAIRVTDTDLSRNGSDVLVDVERIKFSDAVLAFDAGGDAGRALMSAVNTRRELFRSAGPRPHGYDRAVVEARPEGRR